jgi:hypothetical protein
MSSTVPQPAEASATANRARHSTFRRRVSFALPVVVVAAFGSGCGLNHGGVMSNPPPPSTGPTAVTGAPSPSTTPAPAIISNPPFPTSRDTATVVNPAPPTATVTTGR